MAVEKGRDVNARKGTRTAAAAALAGLCALAACGTAAAANPELYISLGTMKASTFANAEGQTLEIVDRGAGKAKRFYERGDMPYTGNAEVSDAAWVAGYNIPWTGELTYSQPGGRKAGVGGIQVYDERYDDGGMYINELFATKVVMRTSSDGRVSVEVPDSGRKGKKGPYAIEIGAYGRGCDVRFEGSAKGDLAFDSLEDGAAVTGASGETTVTGPRDQQRWYLHGKGRHVVKVKGGSVSKVTKASRICGKSTRHRHACGLRASAAPGSSAFLTWKMPAKAKSYRVYRWDEAKARWVRAALRKGRKANYYLAKRAAESGATRFRVRAYRDRAGKRPLGRASYAVSAVSGKGARSNAASVTVSGKGLGPKGLSGKAGGSARLAASVRGAGGKAPASSKVTWWSSDRSVAKVGKRTGKVTFVKKGKCEVWAKAHDGVNSPKVKVKVW